MLVWCCQPDSALIGGYLALTGRSWCSPTNINNFTESQHQTRPLCGHDGSRQTIRTIPVRIRTRILPKPQNNPTSPILARMSNCCFFMNCSFSLTLVFPTSRKDLLKHQTMKFPIFLIVSDSEQSLASLNSPQNHLQ